MLAELTIDLLGRGTHQSADLAELLKIIDTSGLRYLLTPCGTCMEGEWDQIVDVVAKCHTRARAISPHVLTTIRIEDEEGAIDKLTGNVKSVERAAGRLLGRLHPMPSGEGPDAV